MSMAGLLLMPTSSGLRLNFGRLLKISENEYYMGENKDEVMAIHLWGPNDNFDEEVYILFKLDGKAEKLLVVTPPTK